MQIIIISLLVLALIAVCIWFFQTKASHRKFLRDSAHDIRNPLSTVKINTEMAMFNPNIHPEIHTILKSNIEELDRAKKIIDDFAKEKPPQHKS